MAQSGTPWRLTCPNQRGSTPSWEFCQRPRAQPAMALITESMSARISIRPTAHFQNSLTPKSLRRVGDEQLLGVARLLADDSHAEYGQHHGRDRDVDEEAEQALGGHRDLGVACGVAAFADVAGGRLHGEHRPGEDEGPADDQLPAAVDAGGQAEAVEVAEVDLARLEEAAGATSSTSGTIEAMPSTLANVAPRRMPSMQGMNMTSRISGADDELRERDLGAEAARDRAERRLRARVDAEQGDDVVGRQDGVDRGDREPAEPVGPGAEAADVRAPPVAQRAERLEGVGRQPAGPVGHHRGQLGEAEAEHDADRR